MFIIYNFLLSLALLFSPIIIFIRIFLGKEDKTRFIEKYGVFAKKIMLMVQFGYMVLV